MAYYFQKSYRYHVEKTVPKALEERNLFVNKSKTEFYTISRNSSEDWKKCKLVGSKLDSKEDIKHRKSLAHSAFNKWASVLCNRKTSNNFKVRLFSAFVESIFLYNCELWGLTKKDEEEINVLQRNFLRKMFNYRYTETRENWPSNIELYAKTNQIPWSETIRKRRLSFFGHVCRLSEETPARKALKEALNPVPRPRGRRKTTYLDTVKKDLQNCDIQSIEEGINIAQTKALWNYRTLEKVERRNIQ